MIYELFALTGFAFWAWLCLSLLATSIAVSHETIPDWALFWTLLSALIVVGFTDYRPQLDLSELAKGSAAYIAGGAGYMMLRWFLRVRAIKTAYDAGEGRMNTDAKQWVPNRSFGQDNWGFSIPPKPSQFKSTLTTWLMWWPLSALCWLLSDLVVDLYNAIFRALTGTLSRISQAGWGD